MSYKLVSATEMNRQHPTTFHLPPPEDFAALSEGDFVKAGFETNLARRGIRTERMWIEVKSIEGDVITGELNNDPVIFFGVLKLGDPVMLKMENVMSIMLIKDKS